MHRAVVRARLRRRTHVVLALVIAMSATLAFVAPHSAHASNTVVRSNSLNGWSMDDQDLDTTDPSPNGRFVAGPGTVPAGYGSVRQTALSGDKQALVTTNHNGVALSGLTSLSFATYSTSAGPTILTASLKLDVDKDGNGTTDTTLVFEPYEQAAIGTGLPAAVANTWQTWDTSAGKWWSTADGGVAGARRSLAAWNAIFGGAAAIAQLTQSGIRIEVGSTGSSWPNFVGYIDDVVVGATVYDFEPLVITPSALGGWSFEHQDLNASNPAPASSFVNGPGTPASGYGSLSQVAAQGDKEAAITTNHNGASLASLDALSYATFVNTSGSPVLPADLKLDVDKDGNGTTDTTVVYEPYEQVGFGTGPATAANTWQTWNALTGRWWSTKDGGVSGPRRTLAAWNTAFGGSAAIATLTQSGVRIEVGATGTSWPSHDGNVDDVVVGEATYDFETLVPDAPVISFPASNGFVNVTDVPLSGAALKRSTVQITEGASVVATTTTSASGSWTVNHTFGAGVHSIKATATDEAGNQGVTSAVRTFTVDLTAPAAPTITAPGSGATLTANLVQFQGSAEPGATVSVKEGSTTVATATALSNGAWSGSASLLDGPHTVVAIATDQAGNAGPASAARAFSVDTGIITAPAIGSPAPSSIVRNGTLSVSGTAQAGVAVTIKEGLTTLGGTTATGSGTWSLPLTFSEGTHAITAFATSVNGTSPDSPARTFTIDLTAPAAPVITAPASAARLNSRSVLVTGTAEANATVTVKEGGVTRGSGRASSSGAFSAAVSLTDGTHTLTAAATAAAGNQGQPATVTFSIDATSPIVHVGSSSPAIFLAQPVTVQGTASDASGIATVAVDFLDYVTGNVIETVAATLTSGPAGSTAWTATTTTLPLGLYVVRATATDTYGNAGASSISALTVG